MTERIERFPRNTGIKILPGEVCAMKASQTSEWSDSWKLYTRRRISVMDTGKIRIRVQEFSNPEDVKSDEDNPKSKIGETEVFVKDFSSFVWQSKNPSSRNLVLRLTPRLSADDRAQDLSSAPISGTNFVVFDRDGKVWTRNLSLEGAATYVGLRLSQGTIVFSYLPFEGAKEFGAAAGNRIEIDLSPGKVVYLQSESPLLPVGVRAKVYGFHIPDLKSSGLLSAEVKTSDRWDRFSESLKEWTRN